MYVRHGGVTALLYLVLVRLQLGYYLPFQALHCKEKIQKLESSIKRQATRMKKVLECRQEEERLRENDDV